MSSTWELIKLASPERLQGAIPMGNGFLIRCPFHSNGQEKTPSCSVRAEAPVWFCHACQEGGHLSKLLRGLGMPVDLARQALDNADFSEGMHRHADSLFRYYRGPNPYKGPFILDDDILDDWMVDAGAYLDNQYSRVTLRHFEVGYDYSRDRITYPIRNIYGDLVGVSGRTTVEEEPRYKIYKRELQEMAGVPDNYSLESVKKFVLWHGHLVLPSMFGTRSPQCLVIVEGFKAAMWVWQAGYTDVVALIGAYVTEGHADLLATYACPIILLLDNNKAGKVGTWKAVHRLTRNKVTIADYPDLREQPDDLDPDEVSNAIERSIAPLRWKEENHKYVQVKKYTHR